MSDSYTVIDAIVLGITLNNSNSKSKTEKLLEVKFDLNPFTTEADNI